MPIQLNQLNATPKIKFSPKFFDKNLTGSGKKQGLLCEAADPKNKKATNIAIDSRLLNTKKTTYVNGNTTIHQIPLTLFHTNLRVDRDLQEIKIPDRTTMLCAGTGKNAKEDVTVYVDMLPYALLLEEITIDKDLPPKREFSASYQINVFTEAVTTGQKPTNETAVYETNLYAKSGQTTYTRFLTDVPVKVLMDDIPHHAMRTLQAYGCKSADIKINTKEISDYIDQYSLHTGVQRISEIWQTTADEQLAPLFKTCANLIKNNNSIAEHNLVRELQYIETYNIPLDTYRRIYNCMKSYFTQDQMRKFCKYNLNLLLSDTMDSLHQNKPNLNRIQTPQNVNMDLSHYSLQQKNAITTTEPLTLVQSGAGTGKSTVILGRIQYMVEAGVKPEDITVLSFTNAAADHIRELNPNVHSMTIASMIHTIYTENYPNHELSSIDTMMNSIDIYFGTSNQTAIDFRYKLKDIIRNESDAFTKMNNFVEANFDEIIHIMDTIKQTCLEMEIIVCYQKIGILKEPDTITSKHLIIDEVQDNSIFEFIYTLKYVDKHGESLYIVGDCSQTLYEFRASNPKALNVLEGSGVFQTYQLQINYRSNQEILDFANVVLKNIEANQYAHIQLQANSLAKVTEQSFRDKVKLHYERMPRITEFEKSLPAILAKEVKPYLDEKLKAGEQVAFLAYTRKTIKNIQSFLETIYPDKTVVSLVPDKMYNSTIFSEYIKRFWDGAKFLPTKDIANIIMRQINDNLYQLTYSADRVRPTVQKMLADWFNEQNPNIQIWYNQMNNKVITKDQYMQAVKECMLEYEIRSNAIRQSLLSARNKANKENEAVKSANFVLSTIHSAKGLEFENTVVIYRDESAMEEDKKRMYYVAFTRAMKSEFILAYNTVFSPKIEGDYNALIDLLKQKDAASGVNSDDDTTGASASDEMTDEERQEKLQNISAQMQNMRDQLLGKKTEE